MNNSGQADNLPPNCLPSPQTDTEHANKMMRKKRVQFHVDAVADIESVLKKLREKYGIKKFTYDLDEF